MGPSSIRVSGHPLRTWSGDYAIQVGQEVPLLPFRSALLLPERAEPVATLIQGCSSTSDMGLTASVGLQLLASMSASRFVYLFRFHVQSVMGFPFCFLLTPCLVN